VDAPKLSSADRRDPLRRAYHESIIDVADRFQPDVYAHTALLCIDMQYLDAAPGHGIFRDVASSGIPRSAQQYYFDRLRDVVLPNVRRVQDGMRDAGLEVIHVRIQAATVDGRDRSPGHKRLGLLAAPGSKEAEFLDEVAPLGDEIVINKTASGVFSSTNITYVLRNLGVTALYVTGVYTNECVSTTVRDAADLGFFVTVLDDGCATVTEELHETTLRTLKDRYARVTTTEHALFELRHRAPLAAVAGQ
jgi:nicotinamidase-related amidase